MMLRRGIIAVLAALLLCPLGLERPASAAGLEGPVVTRVVGVAKGDVLNVRAEPSARAEIIRTLPPDAEWIEVFETTEDGSWSLIGIGEGPGWVASRFLEPMRLPEGDGVPRPMRCGGMEPIWDLAFGEKAVGWQEFEAPLRKLPVVEELGAKLGWYARAASAEGGTLNLIITPERCPYDPSDRPFGYSAHVFQSRDGVNRMFYGCCSRAP